MDKLSHNSDERNFLGGPRSRPRELGFALTIFWELIKGFRIFHFLGPCVTVFGSARYKEDHPYYQQGRAIGNELAKLGFTVMTGGGPGLMEAVNRGAKEAGGKSVGCNIVLPLEQQPNPYLDKWVYMNYFFIRKVMLSKYSYAFIVLPGGYGTLDEFFEAITLIQTDKIKRFPVILVGKEYHANLYNHLVHMQHEGTISGEDMKLFLFTDSIDEIMDFIDKKAIQQFNLKGERPIKPFRWLGEKSITNK